MGDQKTDYTKEEAIELLNGKCTPGHYDLGSIKPLDTELLHHIFKSYTSIITIEDGVLSGGAGSAVLEWANDNGYSHTVKRVGIPDSFIPHGTTLQLQKEVGLDPAGIAAVILGELKTVFNWI